jgi:hypothetical protein
MVDRVNYLCIGKFQVISKQRDAANNKGKVKPLRSEKIEVKVKFTFRCLTD